MYAIRSYYAQASTLAPMAAAAVVPAQAPITLAPVVAPTGLPLPELKPLQLMNPTNVFGRKLLEVGAAAPGDESNIIATPAAAPFAAPAGGPIAEDIA